MMMLSRTTAPRSTTTPGKSTEFTTSPCTAQPFATRLRETRAPAKTRTGGRSAVCVCITHSGSFRSSGGWGWTNSRLAR